MTWGEFKQQVEEQGMLDNDELIYIDLTPEVQAMEVQGAEGHGKTIKPTVYG